MQFAFGQLVIFTTNRKDEQWKPPVCSVKPANPTDSISWVAQALFPAEYVWEPGNVKAGYMVVINDCNSTSTIHGKMREAIKHEIGHTLGFRHSDALNDGEGDIIENPKPCDDAFVSGRNVICGTPSLDLESIMVHSTSSFGTTKV